MSFCVCSQTVEAEKIGKRRKERLERIAFTDEIFEILLVSFDRRKIMSRFFYWKKG